jgi:hypothetical protein
MKNKKETFSMCGLIEEGGIYFTLPVPGISINKYKRMYPRDIAKYKADYIALVSATIVNYLKREDIESISGDGLRLKKPLLRGRVRLEWVLTFRTKTIRDIPNYNQKILLDAIVDIGIIEDDNEKFLITEKTMFGHRKFDSITCIFLGEVRRRDFMTQISIIKHEDFLDKIGAIR